MQHKRNIVGCKKGQGLAIVGQLCHGGLCVNPAHAASDWQHVQHDATDDHHLSESAVL